MAYFVGKRPMVIGEDRTKRLPGAAVTAAEASSFPGLRRMLERGDLVCDYADGEPRPSELPRYSRPTLVDDERARAALAVAGVDLPGEADVAFVFAVYDVVVLKRPAGPVAAKHNVSLEALESVTAPRQEQPAGARQGRRPRAATSGA